MTSGYFFVISLRRVRARIARLGEDTQRRDTVSIAPTFRVLEVALAGAVLYHGINGIRVIVIDFVQNATRIQKQMWYAVWASFLVLFVPTAFIMLRPVFFPMVGLVP